MITITIKTPTMRTTAAAKTGMRESIVKLSVIIGIFFNHPEADLKFRFKTTSLDKYLCSGIDKDFRDV
jgi:hypothetical protein